MLLLSHQARVNSIRCYLFLALPVVVGSTSVSSIDGLPNYKHRLSISTIALVSIAHLMCNLVHSTLVLLAVWLMCTDNAWWQLQVLSLNNLFIFFLLHHHIIINHWGVVFLILIIHIRFLIIFLTT